MTVTPRRFVLVTLGSLGDLHPYLALGNELAARGHAVTVASHPGYRARVEAEGLAFADVPPDFAAMGDLHDIMADAMDGAAGSRYVIEKFVLPWVDQVYAAVHAATADADLVVGHPIAFAVPSVAERRGLPWVSVALQPAVMFSALDPSVMPGMEWLAPVARRHPVVYRALFALFHRASRPWLAPLDRVRASAGLPPLPKDVAMLGHSSPWLHLALFSPLLAAPQADWPAASLACGFAFHDRDEDGRTVPPGLAEFLAAGDPPIVFTLGSSAVHVAGPFWVEAVAAAERLGRRAVLLVGRDARAALPAALPAGIVAFDYAPHSAVMPQAAAIVHQGGAGTTGQAMRAGRPMVVVPFAHDQPDHAARLRRLGVGLAVPRRQWNAARAIGALARVLDEPSYAARAAEVAAEVRAERGPAVAADALERIVEKGARA